MKSCIVKINGNKRPCFNEVVVVLLRFKKLWQSINQYHFFLSSIKYFKKFSQLWGSTSLTYLLSKCDSVSSASEFTHSLSWQPTWTFKPHTRAVSALAIVLSSQITLIKVWEQGHQERIFNQYHASLMGNRYVSEGLPHGCGKYVENLLCNFWISKIAPQSFMCRVST